MVSYIEIEGRQCVYTNGNHHRTITENEDRDANRGWKCLYMFLKVLKERRVEHRRLKSV